MEKKLIDVQKNIKAPWEKKVSKHEWRNFLDFEFGDVSRNKAYEIIGNYISNRSPNAITELLEIGFGQCYDFKMFFRSLHDSRRLSYSGMDITQQFVNYAKEDYPEYDFSCGGFHDIGKMYDVIFTANTLEHQLPEDYESCLRDMLDKARRLCVIIWFQSPREKGFMHWAPRDGFGNTGAWVNRYDKDKIAEIIKSCGFDFEVFPINEFKSVYRCEKKYQE